MQKLGEGFGQPVRQGLGHDGVVVVVVGFEPGADLIEAEACRQREGSDIVHLAARVGSDKISEAILRFTPVALVLLTEEMQGGEGLSLPGIGVELDVISVGVGREEAGDGPGFEELLRDDGSEQAEGVVVQLAGLFTDDRILKYLRELSRELPGREEWRPVDVGDKIFQWEALQDLDAGSRWRREFPGIPVVLEAQPPSFGDVEDRGGLRLRALVLPARLVLRLQVLLDEGAPVPAIGTQGGADTDGPRCVQHMDHGVRVPGRDLDGCMRSACCRPADQQGCREACHLQL